MQSVMHWNYVGQKVTLTYISIYFKQYINNLTLIFQIITGVRLLCTFHFLQAFWRWLYDSKHKVSKEDRVPIMEKARKILYALSGSEMKIHYEEFKQKFYNHPQLRSHFELLWKRR